MKKWKERLASIMAVAMLLAALNIPAFAEAALTPGGDAEESAAQTVEQAAEEQEITEPEVTEPKIEEPEAEEPEAEEPEVTEPETEEPEITEPEITEPEITEPETEEPEVTEPETEESEVTEPETEEPETEEPEVTEPQVAEPATFAPVRKTALRKASAPAPVSAPEAEPELVTVPETQGETEPAELDKEQVAACHHELIREREETPQPAETCTARAYYIERMKCRHCGVLFSEYKVPTGEPERHNWVEKTYEDGKTPCETETVRVCSKCNTTEKVTANSHEWVEKTESVTGCGERTHTWQECTKCGLRKDDAYSSGSIYTHKFVEGDKGELLVEGDCEHPEVRLLTCMCGKQTRLVYGEKRKHVWGETKEHAADCEHNAYTEKVCSNCGATEIQEGEEKAYGHDWQVQAEESRKPSCVLDGVKVEKCANCDEVRRTTLPAVGHTPTAEYKSDDDWHWQICVNCGIDLQREAHDYRPEVNDGCMKTEKCATCGHVKQDGNSHKWVIVKLDETYHHEVCANCGAERYPGSKAGHVMVWVDGDCTKGKICKICGYEEPGSVQTEHAFTDWTPNTDSGSQKHSRKCTLCGKIEVAQHNYEWQVTRTPTPDAMGLEVGTCKDCGSQATRDVPKASPTPTPEPTPTPTPEPTAKPTEKPAEEPEPEAKPTEEPAEKPTPEPAEEPKDEPTEEPADEPTKPTEVPAEEPTPAPTPEPAPEPAPEPEAEPTAKPAPKPAAKPEAEPERTSAPNAASALGSATVEELLEEKPVELTKGTTVAFKAVENATASGAAAPGTAKLVVRAASIPEAAKESASDVYAALVVAWQEGAALVAPSGRVRVSVPVSASGENGALNVPEGKFKLVRVGADGAVLGEIEFTLEDGMLTFETEESAVYLLIPA